MLIKQSPDAYDKLRILGGMASDDILAPPERRGDRGGPYPSAKKNPTYGVYRASMPNGKFINLMRVMFTDFCKMDCAYCPNSHWVPRKRYAFKVDELARTFMELHRRQTVSGLFLSSGIAGDGSKTTERLVKVVDAVRNKHGFKGYIHMKVMPGAEYQYVEAAHRLGTRLSVNIETPTKMHMDKLSAMKDFQKDILDPMGLDTQAHRGEHRRRRRTGDAARRRRRGRDRPRHLRTHGPAILRVEAQARLLRSLPTRTLHTARRAPGHSHDQEPQAVPDGLAEARVQVLQRRDRPRFRSRRPSPTRPRSQDLYRRSKTSTPSQWTSTTSRTRPFSGSQASDPSLLGVSCKTGAPTPSIPGETSRRWELCASAPGLS